MAMMKTALAVLAAAAMCTAGVATATESGAEALMRALGGEVHGADVQHSSGCCMPPAFSLVSRSYSDGSVTSQMIGLDRSNPQSLEFFSVYQETSSSDTIQTIINGNKGYYIRYSASGADPTCYNFPPPADMFGGEDFCVGPGHHHSEYVSSMKVAGVSAEIWIVPGTAYGTAASCGPSGSRVLGNGGLTNFTVMFNQTDSLPPGYTTPPSFCSVSSAVACAGAAELLRSPQRLLRLRRGSSHVCPGLSLTHRTHTTRALLPYASPCSTRRRHDCPSTGRLTSSPYPRRSTRCTRLPRPRPPPSLCPRR